MKEAADQRKKAPRALSSEEYVAALESYLEGAGESALQRAYEFGRAALTDGVGLLEITRIYHGSLEKILLRKFSPEEQMRKVREAADFFAESISPYEMAYRGFHEANVALRHFNDVLEQEARRIARALHDEAGQLLVAVYIALEEVSWKTPRARRQVQKVKGILDQIEDQLRRVSHELRPTILDDLGLLPALRYLADGISQRTGLKVMIESSPEDRFPPSIEAALYRVIQEALNNITKHSQATRALICIRRESRFIHCTIGDDGVGFDVQAVLARKGEQGFGLVGIRERLNIFGGKLEINTAVGQGTELVISIPLES